jgi:hypothetical protein
MHCEEHPGGSGEGETGEGDNVQTGEGGVPTLVITDQAAKAALPASPPSWTSAIKNRSGSTVHVNFFAVCAS